MTDSRIVSRDGSSSVQSRNFSPILGRCHVRLDIVSREGLVQIIGTHHDSRAIGLLASAKPIVLGRVACSSAYALPVLVNSAARLRPICSESVMVPRTWAGSGMMQKLTYRSQSGLVSKLIQRCIAVESRCKSLGLTDCEHLVEY